MVRLQVSSSNYNCDITLERRVTFLRGDSGTGKTGLVDVINEQRAGNLDITVNCEKPVVAIITEMISDEIPFLRSYKNRVLIFDDLLMSELRVFGNTILDIAVKNDLYFLIISRAELGKYEEKELGLDYSVNSILVLDYDKKNPKNHFTRKVNDLYPECDFSKEKVNCIIAEDTNGISEYLHLSSKPLIVVNGKNNVLRGIRKIKEEDKVMVFADSANFGRNFNNLICLSQVYNIYYDTEYECFEYVLLCSNMLKKYFNFDNDKANSFKSWERYFERELSEITEKTYYRYAHGRKMKDCYMLSCLNCNKEKAKKCDGFSESKDKIKYLLEDTNFSYILKLLGK